MFCGRKLKLFWFVVLTAIVLACSTLIPATKSNAGLNQWTSIGPGEGNVRALAISPNYSSDQTVFAFLAEDSEGKGSLYKSTDGAASWFKITGLSNVAVRSFAISPNFSSDNIIFAVTSSGVYKSSDGGLNWSAVNSGLSNTDANCVAISPNFAVDNTIFVGTNGGGVFKSINGGANWIMVNKGLTNNQINTIVLSNNFASDKTIFAGTWGGGVFKSTDGGTNWSEINSGLHDNTYIRALAISPNFSSDKIVFAASVDNWGYQYSIYKSTNGGVSWTTVHAGLPPYGDALDLKVNDLAISPNFASDRTVFAGTSGRVFESVDAGANWSGTNDGLTDNDVNVLKVSPNFASDKTVFSGTKKSGVFKSTNGGSTWLTANNGFPSLKNVMCIEPYPNFASDKTVFAGTWGGGVFKSTDGGTNWSEINSGLHDNTYIRALAISPNFSSDKIVFAASVDNWGYQYSIYKSTNGGVSWTTVHAGLPPYGDALDLKVNDLAISPNFASDKTVFAATSGGIYKTVDAGSSWIAANIGIADVRSLAISPNFATDKTIFAGAASGIFKSTDGGVVWTEINTGITNKNIRILTISPTFQSDQTIFALASKEDYWNNTSNIYKSIDGGASWSEINSSLTSLDVRDLVCSPNYATDSSVFASAGDNDSQSGGVFYSVDGCQSWTAVATGLSNTDVNCLGVSPDFANDKTLFAGTNGSGIFSYTFGAVDLEAPNPPTVVSSTHPTQTTWYSNNDPAFSWSASDKSGIIGYSYTLDRYPTTLPGSASYDMATLASYTGKADGIWYFHVRACDGAGNWSLPAHFRVQIDTTKPRGKISAAGFSLKRPGAVITYRLVEGCKVKVKAALWIKKGKSVVKTLFNFKWMNAQGGNGKSYKIKWNGRSNKKRLVSAGKYIIELRLIDPTGKRNVVKARLVVKK